MSNIAIRVEHLVKHFGEVVALTGIDFEVPAGTVFGLLGPNGAGKTTAVRILTTILHPDGGQARVLGFDVAEEAESVRRVIGLAGQFAAVDGNLTARENLRLAGWLTDLAIALVHRPPVLFLDEPTTGLDPQGRSDLWQVIEELVADGTSLLLTTQYLEEADRLADRIAVIDNGRVVAEGTATELKTQLG